MKVLRHFAFLLCLAFAFAIGQQGGLLHTLGHATEQLQQKGHGQAPKVACEQCGLAAQLGSVPAAGLPPVAMVAGSVPAVPLPEAAVFARRVAVFRSRAPPVLS